MSQSDQQKEPWRDLDGWEKNVSKFKNEFQLHRIGMHPHWKRMKEEPSTHAYVNLFVESVRLAPYTWGHAIAIGFSALVIGLAVSALLPLI